MRPAMIERFLHSVAEYQCARNERFDRVIVGDDSDAPCMQRTRHAIEHFRKAEPDVNVAYREYDHNIGCSAARNAMIDEVETELFLYCDDDYILDTECDLTACVNMLTERGLDLLSGWWKHYDESMVKYWTSNFMGAFDIKGETVNCFIYMDELPLFRRADYHTNFYLARTEPLRRLKWNVALKTEEHPEFFLRAFKANLQMAFTNRLFTKHHHVTCPEYARFRNIGEGGRQYLFLRLKEAQVRTWTTYYIGRDTIRRWYVDGERELNEVTYYHRPSQAALLNGRFACVPSIVGQRVQIVRLSPEKEQLFFGYYDLQALDASGQNHLALRVPFADRRPGPDDEAEICLVSSAEGVKVLDKTKAWNFQQGAMLQYRPRHANEIVYNVYDEKGVAFRSVVYSLESGRKRVLPMPVASISTNGKLALSLNFARLLDYRPGYGYCNAKDPYGDAIKPADDGVFLMNVDTGACKLIVSYATLWETFAKGTGHEHEKLVVNHVAFNTDGTRFLMLLRFFSPTAPWPTITVTADTDGGGLRKIFNFSSHYHWKDPTHLVISGADVVEKPDRPTVTAYELEEVTAAWRPVDLGFFKGDGHCSYSPDRQYMLYDSYTSMEFPFRKLSLYDLRRKKGVTLAYLYSNPALYHEDVDCRCDLHPRWAPDGSYVTFDSIHEGYRGIYRIETAEAIREIDRDLEALSETDIRRLIAPPVNRVPLSRLCSAVAWFESRVRWRLQGIWHRLARSRSSEKV